MTADSVKHGMEQVFRLAGQTFTITRGDDSHQIRGTHDTATGRFNFPADADVREGDRLISVATQREYVIARVTPHVMDDQITYIETWSETAEQQARRLASERAQTTTAITIDSIAGSIVNITSDLAHVTQSISTLPPGSQIDDATIAALLDHLRDVIRTATELADRLQTARVS